MPLTILNNSSSFQCRGGDPALGHLGTRDRDNPDIWFDFPGKANFLLQAASDLQSYVSRLPGLKPIAVVGSERFAEEADLMKVHLPAYLAALKQGSEKARAEAKAGRDSYIPFGKEADVTPGTYRAALHSVGTAFDAVDVALQGENATAFALVWPAGHHAEPDQAMGFCYLSNAALAALYARDHRVQLHPGRCNRVVVIDIDHHRGNGTAAGLAGKEDVLFVDLFYRSKHDVDAGRYADNAREYPYEHDDASRNINRHESRWATKADNIRAIGFEGMQDHHAYLRAFVAEALPAIRAFKPDLVIWSLGLDAAKGDPLGGLGLHPSSFYTLVKGMRLAFPEARHCGVLEGGYDQKRSGRCLKPALMALHDEPEHSRSKTFRQFRSAFLNTDDIA